MQDQTVGLKALRLFSPLAITICAAVAFLFYYNHFLLDKTVANLKFSLKKLQVSQGLEEVKKIGEILDDTFLMEMVKADLETTTVARLEFSAEIAARTDDQEELEHARHLMQSVVEEKERGKSKLEIAVAAVATAVFSGKQYVDIKGAERMIQKLQQESAALTGEKLQEKHLEIARLQILSKEWPAAIESLTKTIALDSENETGQRARMYLGMVYKHQGNFVEAQKVFQDIEAAATGEMKDFIRYQQADTVQKAGQLDEAIDRFKQVFDVNSDDALGELAQFRAGYSELYDLKDDARAVQSLRKISTQNGKVNQYVSKGMFPQMSLKQSRTGYRILEEGFTALQEGRLQEALAHFDFALEVHPENALAYTGKSLAFHLLQQPEQSMEEALRAKEINRTNALVLGNLAYINYVQGNLSQAVLEYREAIRLAPDVDNFYYNLGTLDLQLHNYEEAKVRLAAAIKLNPSNVEAYNNLGYVLWRQRSYNQAKEALERALRLNPEHIDAHYNLGVVLFTLGNYEGARKHFLWVSERSPNFRKTKFFLSRIKEKVKY